MLKRWVEVAGVYIHIPFCTSKCRYCDFTSYPGKIGFAEAYMACVYKEIKLRAGQLKDKVFDTVYFGGGTPSVMQFFHHVHQHQLKTIHHNHVLFYNGR